MITYFDSLDIGNLLNLSLKVTQQSPDEFYLEGSQTLGI